MHQKLERKGRKWFNNNGNYIVNKCFNMFIYAGAEPVVVRNLRPSLLNGGPAPRGESAVDGNAPLKKTRVAVLISGTGVFSMFWYCSCIKKLT